MATKFTFKREARSTGLAAIGNPYPNVEVKLGGKQVGWINAPCSGGSDKWHIWFHIEKSDPKAQCPFRNAKLKGEWGTEEEARDFLRTNAATLIAKFKFVPRD